MDSICATAPAPPDKPVDVEDLLDRCLGRIELAERILQRFQSALEVDLQQLEAAVRATNTDEIAHVAHRIKGASLAVAASSLKDCAQSIEASATARRIEEIPVQLTKLKQERSRFNEFRVSLLPKAVRKYEECTPCES
jgi:HPt (histidine-containing phosphotransfer) domain-containing protein